MHEPSLDDSHTRKKDASGLLNKALNKLDKLKFELHVPGYKFLGMKRQFH
jgi:hypothetical protein